MSTANSFLASYVDANIDSGLADLQLSVQMYLASRYPAEDWSFINSTNGCCLCVERHFVGSPYPNQICTSCCKALLIQDIQMNPEKYTINNLAYFSSFGVKDGRWKPDLVAPGDRINSARSNSGFNLFNCSTTHTNNTNDPPLLAEQGTSMAAPVVAGNAALIRQYLREGYYPNGTESPGDGFLPSAALLKAMLINSAEDLTGGINTNQFVLFNKTKMSQRRNYYGFGRINLSTLLPFASSKRQVSGNGLNLVLAGTTDPEISSQGDTNKYCVNATQTTQLQITLVWTDFPGEPNALIPLVNDLTLVFYDQNTQALLLGNDVDKTRVLDDVNNVEKISINIGPGIYSIGVIAYKLPYNNQSYALVLTGFGIELSNALNDCADIPKDLNYSTTRSALLHPSGLSLTIIVAIAVTVVVGLSIVVIVIILFVNYTRKKNYRLME